MYFVDYNDSMNPSIVYIEARVRFTWAYNIIRSIEPLHIIHL